MASRLDIIVFGATGFTGKFTLPQVHKFATSDGRSLTWGVAGRSEQKLRSVLSETAKRIGGDLNQIPVIIADVQDEKSIKEMAAQARVVINCCGPFALYGEVVVKSCIEAGTHYVDVTGETQFIADVEQKYHKTAEEKGVYIVNACGYDSVVSDLGIVFLDKNFKGTLNSVELYASASNSEENSGSRINYGSWESFVHAVGDYKFFIAQYKKHISNPLLSFQPKLKLKYPIHKIDSKWAFPALLADYDIVQRSQLYFYKHDHKRPIQMHMYATFDSFFYVLLLLFFGFIYFTLSQFKYGRNLLLKYPSFFTNGILSTSSPSEETIQHERFCTTLYGKGWAEKLAEGADQYKTPPNKMIVGRISGINPGYDFTCVAVTLCAILILTESKLLPAKGGVYTPAIAFGKTSLIAELEKNNTVFEIVSLRDI